MSQSGFAIFGGGRLNLFLLGTIPVLGTIPDSSRLTPRRERPDVEQPDPKWNQKVRAAIADGDLDSAWRMVRTRAKIWRTLQAVGEKRRRRDRAKPAPSARARLAARRRPRR